MGAKLSAAIKAAHLRRGKPLEIGDYEGFDAAGRAWLPNGLPDNPLTPSVAWVWQGCVGQAVPTPPPDWLVCPSDQSLRAGGLPDSPVWSIQPGAPASSGDATEAETRTRP